MSVFWRRRLGSSGLLLVAALLCLSTHTLVRAGQRVIFTGGGSLEIEGYRLEGGLIFLDLKGGGELGCRPGQIDRFEEVAEPSALSSPAPLTGRPPQGTSAPLSVGRDQPLPPVSPLNPEPGVRALIRRLAPSWDMDPELVEAVVRVESNFDPYAVSHRGAMGLMQLMPQTARRYRVKNVFDPVQNLEGGIRYLKELLARYGEVSLALAAYNAGERAVDRAGGIPPYRETRTYVGRILNLIQR